MRVGALKASYVQCSQPRTAWAFWLAAGDSSGTALLDTDGIKNNMEASVCRCNTLQDEPWLAHGDRQSAIAVPQKLTRRGSGLRTFEALLCLTDVGTAVLDWSGDWEASAALLDHFGFGGES